MPTTLVKSVNFYCRSSRTRWLLELAICQLFLLALTVTSTPLPLTFFLIGYLFRQWDKCAIFLPQFIGYVHHECSGAWKQNKKTEVVEDVDTTFSQWCLIIRMESGVKMILWRDSCSDWVYRYVVVTDKQRRYTSALS
ncbi:hypothetical protein OAP63_07885 [Vibrio sp.]|uniref:hypothetical protein n=1 Tax=Vibrio viridaestus TaxID=2487322 RepID=UPI000F6084BD|nr:hypothetical protein [Vibrio viridaestus]MDC0610640.1 hypothetical protein [Vibrio sp.]